MVKSKGIRLSDIIIHVILIAGAITMILPFIWALATSFKPASEVLSWPPSLIVKSPTLSNYIRAFKSIPFGKFFLNSLVVATLSSVAIVLTSAISGYIFAKFDFSLKNSFFILILSTSMLPLESYMMPLYSLMLKLGWINTFQGLVAPYLIMSFGVFFMRQNMTVIPDELLEAARIDGCTELGIFTKVVLPMSSGPLSALGIFAFRAAWSAFIWPLIVAQDHNLFTVELGLSMFHRQFSIDYGLVSAGAIVSILPVLLVFVILRERIVESTILTGIKG